MNPEKYENIADIIYATLKNNPHLKDNVLNFIDSTFSSPSAKKLEEIINDDSCCEKDSLVELIFFPDEALQVKIEKVAEDMVFQKHDKEKILHALMKKKPETIIHLPGKRGALKLPIPMDIATQMISRLNLTAPMDKNLITGINTFAENKARRLLIKVKLRNARLKPDGVNTQFLYAFFKKMVCEDKLFFQYLDYMLSFLRRHKPERDIFQELMAMKQRLNNTLYRARQFEEKLEKNNIETLLLRGETSPGINKEETEAQINIIDQVCLAVFGKNSDSEIT